MKKLTEVFAERDRVMDAAIQLVHHGRWWANPSDEDVLRAASCIILDPWYRAEICRDAATRARDMHDATLAERLLDAQRVLEENAAVASQEGADKPGA